ncbi:MAG: hypothetical protein RID07_07335, partial [Lacipirellulaceae bacterium]
IAKRQMTFEESHTVDPHQLLGIELNPRAAAIAELVLWIGFLQWHFRTRGKVAPPEPVIKNFQNIECRDAVLKWSKREMVTGEDGRPVTIWDGRTTKPHPVTGEEVPDETARVPMYEYHDPEKAEWPEADYVVGNPPFIGTAKMRHDLGDGYTDAVRKTYKELPESCDYVMFWWHKAAGLATRGQIERFGFIATNSLRQTFNRRVVEQHLSGKVPLSIIYAIPDHPWVDAALGAAVRISMTVAAVGIPEGRLLKVVSEEKIRDVGAELVLEEDVGPILANLRIGAAVGNALPLQANDGISNPGVKLHGAGFIIEEEEATELIAGSKNGIEKHIRHYRNGRDLTQTSRNVLVIDLLGLSSEDVRDRFPAIYQRLLERVKPERDQNRRATYRENWWIFGEPRKSFRPALSGLPRYIATVETSKHRFFTFLDESILPDNMLVNVATDDAHILGVLSSRIHVTWALAAGGRLGVGNDPRYNKTVCFETFPFPDATEPQKARIRELGEQLDAHRKRQQELHPKLTMTGMYNVLEKLRSDEELTEKEKTIHEQGLVSVLRQIHDDLDAAVADAYGWPVDLSDEEILERLVALNHERAEEEKRGLIRWLRPEYQNPDGATQQTMLLDTKETKKKTTKQKIKKQPWPKKLGEQAAAVSAALAAIGEPADEALVAKRFTRANKQRIAELLETLAGLGRARELEDGRFLAV